MIRNFSEAAVSPSAYDNLGDTIRKDMGVHWAPLYVNAPNAKNKTKDVDRPFYWDQYKPAKEAPPAPKKEVKLFTPPELNKKNANETKIVSQEEQKKIKIAADTQRSTNQTLAASFLPPEL